MVIAVSTSSGVAPRPNDGDCDHIQRKRGVYLCVEFTQNPDSCHNHHQHQEIGSDFVLGKEANDILLMFKRLLQSHELILTDFV